MFYVIIMFKRKISGKRRNEQITQDISRKGYAMRTSLALNNLGQGTTPSREESSLEDKDGSWSDVTSHDQMSALTHSEG